MLVFVVLTTTRDQIMAHLFKNEIRYSFIHSLMSPVQQYYTKNKLLGSPEKSTWTINYYEYIYNLPLALAGSTGTPDQYIDSLINVRGRQRSR